ncbi:MAG: Wzz/FepE/Etk N-terminal domain-containing protein [Gemmatirosa sp.]
MSQLAVPPVQQPLAPTTGGAVEEITFFDLVALVLRNWWRIGLLAVIGGLIAAVPALMRKPRFTATASFILQGGESPRSGLAGLAGQLGMALPTAGGQSPQFYADLLRTRELLTPIVEDSFAVTPGGPRTALVDLLKIEGATPAIRRERAVQIVPLAVLGTRLAKTTGVVTVVATTGSPELSRALVERALIGLNDFSLRMRQSQAGADRRFSEERVRVTRESLRRAEDRLQRFLQSNREWENSPALSFQHDRLQREVALQQQVFNAASEAIEDARGREMRDTPVLTVVDTPVLPASRDPRGTVRLGVVGAMVGAFAGFVLLLAREALTRRRAASAAGAASDGVLGKARWTAAGRATPAPPAP